MLVRNRVVVLARGLIPGLDCATGVNCRRSFGELSHARDFRPDGPPISPAPYSRARRIASQRAAPGRTAKIAGSPANGTTAMRRPRSEGDPLVGVVIQDGRRPDRKEELDDAMSNLVTLARGIQRRLPFARRLTVGVRAVIMDGA